MSWCAGYGMDSATAFAVGMGAVGSAAGYDNLSPAEKEAATGEAVDRMLAQAGKG